MRVADLPETTPEIKQDEKCWGLMEVDMLTEDYQQVHRYRMIYVIRDDKPVPFVEDLHETGRYSFLDKQPPLRIYTLLEHTVAETIDMADDAHDRGSAREFLRNQQLMANDDRLIIKEFLERESMREEFMKRNPRTVASIKGNK